MQDDGDGQIGLYNRCYVPREPGKSRAGRVLVAWMAQTEALSLRAEPPRDPLRYLHRLVARPALHVAPARRFLAEIEKDRAAPRVTNLDRLVMRNNAERQGRRFGHDRDWSARRRGAQP